MTVINFIDELKSYIVEDNVFNPWGEYTDEYDIGISAPKIRREHLQRFLDSRITTARCIFVAEALGYQGGRFSGIPMTSERIITGAHPDIHYHHVFNGESGTRTSNPNCAEFKKTQRQIGFSEQTATIVWKAILEHHMDPYEIILWNIFPFHPFEESKGMLSNRTPSSNELEEGIYFLKKLLSLCQDNIQIVGIGNHANNMLDRYGISSMQLTHPAKGGVRKFREGFAGLFSYSN